MIVIWLWGTGGVRSRWNAVMYTATHGTRPLNVRNLVILDAHPCVPTELSPRISFRDIIPRSFPGRNAMKPTTISTRRCPDDVDSKLDIWRARYTTVECS